MEEFQPVTHISIRLNGLELAGSHIGFIYRLLGLKYVEFELIWLLDSKQS